MMAGSMLPMIYRGLINAKETATVLHQMMATMDIHTGILHYAALGGVKCCDFASKSNSATILFSLSPGSEKN